MEANNTHFVNHKYRLSRYKKSVNIKGHTIYFDQPVTDVVWYQIIMALEHLCAEAYNNGVDDTRLVIKEALGIHGN